MTQDARIAGVHQLRTRMTGSVLMVQMHVDLDAALSLKAAHDIILAAEERVLKVFPQADILIHADPRGGADYNLRLSQARAESVVDYLAGRHGIPRDRLRPIGKGQTELANPGRPTAPENRRVTIKTLQ